jgi:outer membrane protein OmpA-like peptidoglycan-associated protein
MLFASCALMLSSCEVMRDAMRDISGQPRSTVAVTNAPFYTPKSAAGGSVQIYGLDGAAPAAEPAAGFKPLSSDGGMRSGRDGSVTVYPFDNGYGRGEMRPLPIGPTSGLTPMMAPSTVRPAAGPGPTAYLGPEWGGWGGYGSTRVYFEHGVAQLDDQAKQVIENAVRNSRPLTVQVDGHASTRVETDDPTEGHVVNLKISMDRAYNVTRQLIRDGVPAQAIRTSAWGDAHPAFAAEGKSAEDASRRVEIYLSPSSSPYLTQ